MIEGVDVISHPVDKDYFFPLNFDQKKRNKCISKLFPNKYLDLNPFFVLNGNRNIERKRLDLTIKSFHLFHKNSNTSAYLVLHRVQKNSENSEIHNLVEELGIEDRVLFSESVLNGKFLSAQNLNELYNLCDVGINTAMGEGWGLVSFEHAATGKAQITSGISNLKDIWGDLALHGRVDSFEEIWSYPGIQMEVSNVASLETILSLLYNDKKYLELASKQSFNHANSEDFSNKTISESWYNLVSKLLI
jgi:glycosyltransferase involved in cell wall biosynthesis